LVTNQRQCHHVHSEVVTYPKHHSHFRREPKI
jgi:hypothetical protein